MVCLERVVCSLSPQHSRRTLQSAEIQAKVPQKGMVRGSIRAEANLLVLADSEEMRGLDAFDSICPQWLKICRPQHSGSEMMVPHDDESRPPQEQPQRVVSFGGNECSARE